MLSASPATDQRSRAREQRRRTGHVAFRLLPDELGRVATAAAIAGRGVGDYARAATLAAAGDAPPAPVKSHRPRRRPSPDLVALERVLGAVGRVGGNVHQLLRHANSGRIPDTNELRAAATAILEMRRVLLEAVGRGD